MLKVSQDQSTLHRIVALTAVGFVLAGAIFGFPGSAGKSLLSWVWILPHLFLPMIAMALLVLGTAARPYLPMGSDWQKPAAAAAIFMGLGLMGPVILWLLYALTLGPARASVSG